MRELPDREAAVLAVLRDAGGRVVARDVLARAAGLGGLSARRVDGVLVRLRRVLPVGALVTVRGRGWALVHADGSADPSTDPSADRSADRTADPSAGRSAGREHARFPAHEVGTVRKRAGHPSETPTPYGP